MKTSYFRSSKSDTPCSPSVGGSITGKQGNIDLAFQALGKTKGTKHTIVIELPLDEAEELVKTMLSEIEEVKHKVTTGKWKHELEDLK